MRRVLAFLALTFFSASSLAAETAVKKTDPPQEKGVWKVRNSKGAVVRTERDTNGDGKPDSYSLLLKGRQVVLREDDKNFDGKIDSRRLTEWATIKQGQGQPPLPGYRSVWREQDTDFDGKIDAYVERGNKTPGKKIGSAMNPAITPLPDEAPPPSDGGSAGERLVKSRNDRYGLDK